LVRPNTQEAIVVADKSSAGAAAGRAPVVDQPGSVRNVVLVGHSGAGKTTLTEALLVATGTIPRAGRVEDGTTVSDYDDAEIRQQRSVSLAVAPVEHAGVKINLLDTPGYADFVGDLRAGLRAADAALFVVSATDGIDGATRLIWDECAAVGMPRAVVVSKLDSPRADFAETLTLCSRAFGENVLPLYLPLEDGGSVCGVIGLLSQTVFDYGSGARVEREPGPEQLPLIADARNALIEGIIAESEDETLMDRYLAGEQIDPKVLIGDLETAVARGTFYPVLATAATTGLGTAEVLEVLASAFPSPLEHAPPTVTAPDGSAVEPLRCEPSAPLVAEVVKTTTDPYVGRISLVRVFSGTLRPEVTLHVSGHGLAERGHDDHDLDEKIGAISSPLGKTLRPVPHCVAGDICAIAKLSRAETGDTLSDREQPRLVAAWEMPEPLLPVAIAAKSKADEDKLSTALARVVAEEPTVRLERNAETRQLVLWCMGEAHADVLLDRLKTKYGVEVGQVPLRVALRETFGAPVKGHGRHVKQSGGHGQYAICDIEIEPLPSGGGFEFVDKIFGGAIPNQFIPSVEKGVRAQMDRGVAAGYPVVDLRLTLVDGKAHSVDSSDMAFQLAGGLALKDAAAKTQVLLLEPVLEVSVLVADDYVGAVMSDLSSRRGRVSGTEPVGTGRTLVRAEVPEVELTRYAIDLRSLSHGTGTFTRRYLRHEAMPSHLAAKELAVATGGSHRPGRAVRPPRRQPRRGPGASLGANGGRPMRAGDRAPDFELPDRDGRPCRLSTLLRAGPVVLFFYPAAMTAGCTAESTHFRDLAPAFAALGAQPVGISRDPVAKQQEFACRHELGMPLLSDVDGTVAEAFGVRRRLITPVRRVTFVIEPDRRIREVIASEIRMGRHADRALEVLREAGIAPASHRG
jgi:elongation factor G